MENDKMDITPTLSQEKQAIDAYGTDGFKIAGTVYKKNILITGDNTLPLESQTLETLNPDIIDQLVLSKTELLLVGSGSYIAPLPNHIKTRLQHHNIATEIMDTGAACRTYNVLLAEGRNVAVILILP